MVLHYVFGLFIASAVFSHLLLYINNALGFKYGHVLHAWQVPDIYVELVGCLGIYKVL